MKGPARLALAAIIFLLGNTGALGGTRHWTGGAGGPNNLWMTQANWLENASPVPGDDLIFETGAQPSSNNDYTEGTAFETLTIANGRTVFGNRGIVLNDGLTLRGAVILLPSITLGGTGSQIWDAPVAGLGGQIVSSIVTNGRGLHLRGPGVIALTGPISGTGTVDKGGSGTALLQGANTYTGPTLINGGTLLVFGSQPASKVSVGQGTLGGSGTVGRVEGISAGGTIAPGAAENGTGILSVSGDVVVDAPVSGSAFFEIDLKGTTPGNQYDQLNVAGLVDLGLSWTLNVVLGSGFTPTPGDSFVIINNDGIDPVQGNFAGLPEGTLFTVSGTNFVISYRGGDGNDVVLRVPSIWDGGGSDDNWMTPANWVGDLAPFEGQALIFPSNVPRNLNVNNFPDGTRFAGMLVTGPHQFSGNRISLGASGIVTAAPAGQAVLLIAVTLAEPSLFQCNTIGIVTMRGLLDLGPHTLTVNTLGNGIVNLSGQVIGTGEIHKFGSQGGSFDIESTAETSGNLIKVFSGGVLLARAQIDSPIFLDAGGSAVLNNIFFSGIGSIGALTVGGARVSAGPFDPGIGLLTINGNATFAGNNSTAATLVVSLGGATANNQDKLIVHGAVSLQTAVLQVQFRNGFAPPVGASFVVIANDGVDPIQGTFLTKAEGATFAVGSTTFSITYHGGDGNDVVLTVVAAAPAPTPPPRLANISTRLRVLTGENVLIGGMILTGNAPKDVIIRAIGPTLTDFGLPGALPDPTLELFRGDVLVASNDDWRVSAQQDDIENSGFAPGKEAESAIIEELAANTNYTAVVRGKNGQTGVALVEVFDLDELVNAKLANISTRGFVDVDDNVMIAGLIVAPIGAANIKVLVRALGPTLGDFGVQGFLANPTLDLVGSNGTVIRTNNDWKDSQRTEIEAAQLAPTHDAEAALIESLPPGAYTAVVRGNSRTTGVGLVEVYNIP